jgi:hypothetical protein
MPISLIRGGSFYWVQEKARLIRPHSWDLQRRVPLAIAIAWVPLLVLAAMHGGVQDLRALLLDYRVYARVFIAIPLLFIAQITMEMRFREMAQHFLDANIIRFEDLSRFREILRKTRRLRDAKLPEMLIIGLVYVQVIYLVESGQFRHPSWALDSVAGGLTPAGLYSALIAQPLFLVLLAIVAWKWVIWVYVLGQLSRLQLQLDGTNGDLTAGLGFLGEVPRAFVPVALAVSAVVGSNWRSQILSDQLTLEALRWPAAVFAVMMVAMFFLPLALFSPRLLREKRQSTHQYGSLQHLVSLQFRRKWAHHRNEKVEALLAGPDVSSLADLSAAFKNVEQMVTYPFRKSAVVAFLIALALPMIPVVTTRIPLKQIMKGLFDAIH